MDNNGPAPLSVMTSRRFKRNVAVKLFKRVKVVSLERRSLGHESETVTARNGDVSTQSSFVGQSRLCCLGRSTVTESKSQLHSWTFFP